MIYEILYGIYLNLNKYAENYIQETQTEHKKFSIENVHMWEKIKL